MIHAPMHRTDCRAQSRMFPAALLAAVICTCSAHAATLTQATGGVLTLSFSSGETIGISGTASHLTFTVVSTTMTFTNSSADTSYAFAASTTGSPVGSTSSAVNGTNGPTLTSLTISDAGSTGEAVQFGFAGTGMTLPSGATLLVNDGPHLTTFLNNNVNTGTGTQTYSNKITVNGNSALTGSAISFGSTINDSPSNTHTVSITGNAAFNGAVGGSAKLASVSVSGTTTIAANITTGGTQSYTQAVTVGSGSVTSAVLTSTTPGSITFGGTIDGFGAGADSLTINSSGVTYGGAMGSGTGLNVLTVNTTGAQNINQNVVANSVAFNSSTGGAAGNISFGAVTISADSQTFQAGNGHGSSSIDFTNAQFASTTGAATPTTFQYIQDATISDTEPWLPAISAALRRTL